MKYLNRKVHVTHLQIKMVQMSRFYTTKIWKNCNGLYIERNIRLRHAIIVYNEYVDLKGDMYFLMY